MALPPGSLGLPVMGHTADFVRDPLGFLVDRHARYGDVFKTRLFGRPTVLFGGPRAPGELFRSERRHLVVRDKCPAQHRELYGDSVFQANGPAHERARRALAPALLAHDALTGYAPALLHLALDAVDGWASRGVDDVLEACRALTLDACTSVVLGLREPGDVALLRAGLDDFVAGTGVRPLGRHAAPRYRRALRAAAALRGLFRRRMAAVRERPDGSVLTGLVEAAEQRGDTEAVPGHLLAVLVAARETTASLLTWLLVELASHDGRRGPARAEAATALGRPAALLDRRSVPHLGALLLEVERLHSPNVIALRSAVTAGQVAGFDLPAGWTAAYSPVANHLDARAFPAPREFRPERFLEDPAGARRPAREADLLTFGRGMRSCPGRPVAELLALAVASAVAARYEPAVDWGAGPLAVRHLPAKAPAGPVRMSLLPAGG